MTHQEDTHQLLEKIFASLHEAIFVVEHESGQIINCNPAALKMLGYSREEMIGASALITHVDESALEEFRKLLFAAEKEQGYLFLPEFNLKRKDGTVFPAEHHVRPIKDSEGKIIAWVSAVTDISLRKAAAEALQKSRETAERLARENAVVAEIGRIVGSSLEISKVYEAFAREVKKLIGFDRLSLYLLDGNRKELTQAFVSGPTLAAYTTGISVSLTGTLASEVVRTRSSFLIQRNDYEALQVPFVDVRAEFQAGFRSSLSVPLISGDQAIGVLNFLSRKSDAYTQREVQLAERVGNQIAGAIANAQLYAELRKTEEELRKQKGSFQLLVENAPFGIMVTDHTHKTKYINHKFQELFGYALSDIPDAERWFEKAFPDESYRQEMVRSWRDDIQKARQAISLSKSINVCCKDRSEKIVNITLVSLSTGEYMFACEDITDRRRAEDALKESELRYRTAIEHCNDGVLITRAMKNLFANRRLAEMFGYGDPDEIINIPFCKMVHPESRKCIEETMRIIGRDANPVVERREIKGLKKNGEAFDIELSCSAIVYRGESACLAYLRDITEAKAAEKERALLQEQFRQAQKLEAIGRLAGGVAHDFNNLLTVISGYSEMLLMQLNQDNPLRDNVVEIHNAARKAADLTRHLLLFSRRQVAEMKRLDLNTVVTGMQKLLGRLIGEDIHLSTRLGENLGMVLADPVQIEHAIMNLAVNARDAMPGGGTLTIETANADVSGPWPDLRTELAPGQYVVLSVRDTGCGMTPETMEHIFEPFFTTKEKGKGTGLGLSMVYGIVKQSGGGIAVSSRPSEGTTFQIFLPLIGGTPDEATETTDAGHIGRGSETVLVVEDEMPVRKLAVRMLRKLGYDVLEAADVQEALHAFETHHKAIDIVLSDVIMPQMSGPQLIEQLRNIRRDFKVLYMSGYTDSAMGDAVTPDSGIGYIQKPFTLASLAGKMRELLGGKESNKIE